MVPHGDKTDQVIEYLVVRFPGRLGRTALVKLLYLCDLETHKRFGSRVTDLAFKVDKHGPFDRRFFEHIGHATRAGCIDEGSVEYKPSVRGALYSPHKASQARMPSLSAHERRIVEYVGNSFGHLPLQRLLEVVYSTKPFMRAQRSGKGTVIEWRNEDKEQNPALARLDLGRVMAGEEEALAGRVTPSAALRDEVRRRIREHGQRRP